MGSGASSAGDSAVRTAPLYVVAGPPASGKGTQCKRLADTHGFWHVSLGDLVRDLCKQDSDLGKQVKEFVDRGDFVSDELAEQIIRERLTRPDALAQACLLDGFPRTEKQAAALAERVDVTKFLLLEVPDDTVVARALGRRMDPDTGKIYHLEFLPPPPEAESRLVRRDNDMEESIVRGRLGVYHSQLGGIKQHFTSKLQTIDGTQSVDKVFESISKCLQSDDSKAAPADAGEEDDWNDDEAPAETAFKMELDIAPDKDVGDDGTICNVMVSVKIPVDESTAPADGGPPVLKRTTSGRVHRPPTDVCCVVDISGSMRQKAQYEVDGVMRDDGLTYLDIVKHAVKTVMHILKDADRMAVVAFDNRAELVFPLAQMTADGRNKAVAALEALQPRGRTDIWAGVHAGMEALRTPTKDGQYRQKSILLLTDGLPNEVPEAGHIPSLKNYKECHPDFSFQLNTFGFGYSLDSELLLDLAIEGQGTFSFIPDALIVGTCFVSSVSNALSMQTQNAMLHLMPAGGAEFNGPVTGFGGDLVKETSWGRVVSLGPMQFGTSREVVVPMNIPAGAENYLQAVLVYPSPHAGEIRFESSGCARMLSKDAIAATARAQTVDVGYMAVQKGVAGEEKAAQEAMAKVLTAIEVYEKESSPHAFVPALKADVGGRMTKALQGLDRFNRWGKHYLRALTRAHQLQMCTNFMDAGLQPYGGCLFRALREEGDAIFVSIPPPKPAAPPARPAAAAAPSSGGGGSSSRAKSPNMSTYYAGSGGG